MNATAKRALDALREAGLSEDLLARITKAAPKSSENVYAWTFIPKDVLAKAKASVAAQVAAQKFTSSHKKAKGDNSQNSFLAALQQMGAIGGVSPAGEPDFSGGAPSPDDPLARLLQRAGQIDTAHGGSINRPGQIGVDALYAAAKEQGISVHTLDAAYQYTTGHGSENVAVATAPSPTAKAIAPAAAAQAPPPPIPPAPTDPFAGKSTAQIKVIQKQLGVTADGIAGPKTRAAYDKANGTTTATASAQPRATTGLGSGSGGGVPGAGGGGPTTAAPVTPSPTQMNDQQIRDYVATKYGYAASYLNDPELGPILLNAAKNVWGEDELKGALFKTQWWQHTTASQREFDKGMALDPASTNQQVTDRANQLATQATQLGITIDPTRINQIAKDSLRNGWTPQQIQQGLGHEFVYKPAQAGQSQQTGMALTTEQQIKDIAGQYLVPMSDQTLAQWERNILSGDVTIDQFSGFAREQAKSLFPGLASAIDKGVTVAQYTAPYREIAAKELEKAPDSIDFMDPKFMRGISQIDPKTGDRTAMNLADWTNYLRSTPEWRNTNRANEMASGLTQSLLQTFGAVA